MPVESGELRQSHTDQRQNRVVGHQGAANAVTGAYEQRVLSKLGTFMDAG